MLKNIIIAVLAAQSVVSCYLIYRTSKAMESLKILVAGLNMQLEKEFKKVSTDLANELKKQIYNMSFMGIKIK